MMFFAEYVTSAEVRAGQINADILMNRVRDDADHFLGVDMGFAPIGASIIEVSILLQDKVYDLELGLYPEEPELTGVFWGENQVNQRRAFGGGDTVPLPGGRVPLKWEGIIQSLSTHTGISKEEIAVMAVDLHAYWDDYPDEYLKVPLKRQRAKYTLNRVHQRYISA